jgi:flagellar hook-length control protein FliK
MKLVQDTPQKLPTVSLIGVGLSTNSDNSGANKSPTFAEDLRQQISEAVASSRTRQRLLNQPAKESPPQAQSLPNAVDVAQNPIASDATLPKSTEPHTDLVTDTLAAGGSLLPQQDQSLPVNAESGIGVLAAYPVATSALLQTNPADYTVISLPTLPVVDAGAMEFNGFTITDLAINDSQFLQYSEMPSANNGLPLQYQEELHTLPEHALNTNTPEPMFAGLVELTSLPVSETLLSQEIDDSVSSLPPVFLTQDIRPNEAQQGAFAILKPVVSEISNTDNSATTKPVTASLTAAYDLSLPEVMPEGIFPTPDVFDTVVSDQPQPVMTDLLTASIGQLLSGAMVRQSTGAPSASETNRWPTFQAAAIAAEQSIKPDLQTLQLTDELPEIMVDLQTKGSEPVNSAASRSAYVNSLIAGLLGNSTDIQQTANSFSDFNNQSKLLMPAQSPSAFDSMQSLDDLLMPTKSAISDQQLLANVAAVISESSVASQGATLYNADQRLQQAAEARLAHLQGLQTNSNSLDIAAGRSSGTMMASLDASFGQAGWAERIGRQILLQSAQGSSSAQIQLDPPELGSLMIKLQLVDQTATVNFVSPHAMVRDALEQQTARLQEMFREQGMSLLDVSVSDQSADSRQDSERQTAGRGNSSNPPVLDSTEPENLVSVRQSSSLVDYYA